MAVSAGRRDADIDAEPVYGAHNKRVSLWICIVAENARRIDRNAVNLRIGKIVRRHRRVIVASVDGDRDVALGQTTVGVGNRDEKVLDARGAGARNATAALSTVNSQSTEPPVPSPVVSVCNPAVNVPTEPGVSAVTAMVCV